MLTVRSRLLDVSASSPEKLQAELDLPRCCRRAGDSAGSPGQAGRIGCRWGREHDEVRGIKVRAIQDVENLRPELQLDALVNGRVLQNGKVPGGQPGSAHRVAA